MTVYKPYWVIGDGRTLQFQGDVTYFVNDTAIGTTKAKWDGNIEVLASDGKVMSVGIVERVVDDMIAYNDLLADLTEYVDNSDYVIKMDKNGQILGVENFDALKKMFVEQKSRDLKEGGKVSKADKQQFADSVEQALVKNDRLRNSVVAYAENFLDIYGKVVPATTNMDTVRNMTSVNTRRYFSQATKNIDANQIMYLSEVKGPKFTLNESMEYDYAGMQDFLVNINVKDPVFEQNTHVKDFISTIYDAKLGWPQKITEELTVTNGKYKVVYKWAVKFNKEK